jgi:hypothetical protein
MQSSIHNASIHPSCMYELPLKINKATFLKKEQGTNIIERWQTKRNFQSELRTMSRHPEKQESRQSSSLIK